MKTFDELNLIAPLHRALEAANYREPTPVQAQTIPAALDGRDILGCAQTGTGKTAAFALPILDWLGDLDCRAIPHRPAALVLAPTRELAIQIGDSFDSYGQFLRIRTCLIYGGVNQASQVRSLKKGAHVVVATPGRLLDLMEQKHIALNYLKRFVLDEADQMLNMGFLPDLRKIIKHLPPRRQSMFFSATVPPKIQELARRLLHKPLNVNVTPKTVSVKKIDQSVIHVTRGEKRALLNRIIGGNDVERAIVFTRTKRGANVVADKLGKQGVSAAAIHGNKSQNARLSALDAFRRKEVRVLVATDIAARGIDIDGITHVINYDMPVEAESYVHRIGRTGRAGATGIAISLCTPEERGELRAIESLIGNKISVDDQWNSSTLPDEPKAPTARSAARPNRRRRSSRDRGRGDAGDKQPSSRRRTSGNRNQTPQKSQKTAISETRPTTPKNKKKTTGRNAAPKGIYFLAEQNFGTDDSVDQNEKPKRVDTLIGKQTNGTRESYAAIPSSHEGFLKRF